MSKTKVDILTLIAVSAFSFMFATAIHEHVGHSLACISVNGHLSEIGAFYADCAADSVSDLGGRFVALAGPLVSLAAGMFFLRLFGKMFSKAGAVLKFFLWHQATVNLMIAAGYLLFSGVAGIGDLGTVSGGVFYQAEPEWLYRAALTVFGLAGYYAVIRISIQKMDAFIGGEGVERVNRAQMASLVAYFSGGAVALLIGLLNPHGIFIVLAASVASSMGGTSGMAWMMQLLDRKKNTGDAPFTLQRNWGWILGSGAFLLIYAAVFGPTIFLK